MINKASDGQHYHIHSEFFFFLNNKKELFNLIKLEEPISLVVVTFESSIMNKLNQSLLSFFFHYDN